MPKGTAVCNSIVGLMYNAAAWANVADNAASGPLTNTYVRLATASYSAANSANANETAYTNYAGGVAVARTTGGWSAPSGGATSNVAAVEFPQCGVTGATITSACISTAASGHPAAVEVAPEGTIRSCNTIRCRKPPKGCRRRRASSS